MSVRSLLDNKIEVRRTKVAQEERRAIAEATLHKQQFEAAVSKIAEDLEGLDVVQLNDGLFKVNYKDFYRSVKVWVEVGWHLEEVSYCDECRGEKEWRLKVAIATQAVNNPDMYCSVDSFAEHFSDFLLRLS